MLLVWYPKCTTCQKAKLRILRHAGQLIFESQGLVLEPAGVEESPRTGSVTLARVSSGKILSPGQASSSW